MDKANIARSFCHTRPRFHAIAWIVVCFILHATCAVFTTSVCADDSNPSTIVITGRVVDELNQPIPEATVQLDLGFRKECVSVTSDEDGRFEIQTTEVDSATEVSYRDKLLWVYADGFNVKCVRPQLRESGFVPCLVSLKREDAIRVEVVAQDGEPCADAIVEPYYYDLPNGVYYSEKSTGLTGIVPPSVVDDFRVTTDERGIAAIKGMHFNKLNGVTVRLKDTQPQLFRCNDQAFIKIELEPTGTIIGSIVALEKDAELPNLEGKEVFLESTNSNKRNNGRFGGDSVTCSTWSKVDAQGNFVVKGMMAGNLSAGLAIGEGPYQPYPTGHLLLLADDELDVEIEVARAVLVRGRLITDDSEEPIELGRVHASPLIQSDARVHSKTATSDQDGYYQLYLHPGRYSLQPFNISRSKHANDYSYPQSANVAVIGGVDELEVPDLRFPPFHKETGQLLNSKGTPIANRKVALLVGQSPHAVKYGASDGEGGLTIRMRPDEPRLTNGDSKWVIYPVDASKLEGDLRDYPTLRVESESPLVLVQDEVEE